jgi:hypothetical protein
MAAEQDWGFILATMANLFHMGPDAVANLTEAQISMYMENSGAIRLQRDMPQLSANFGQLSEEARQKMVDEADKAPDPNSLDARAWRIFIRNYQTAKEEALSESQSVTPLMGISPEAAEGIVRWWESGALYKLPGASTVWRVSLMPIHKQLLARAAQTPTLTP